MLFLEGKGKDLVAGFKQRMKEAADGTALRGGGPLAQPAAVHRDHRGETEDGQPGR